MILGLKRTEMFKLNRFFFVTGTGCELQQLNYLNAYKISNI